MLHVLLLHLYYYYVNDRVREKQGGKWKDCSQTNSNQQKACCSTELPNYYLALLLA